MPQRVHSQANQTAGKGFQSLGEFLFAAYMADVPGGGFDRRLNGAVPTNHAGQATGADGGYLVQEDFAQELIDLSLQGPALLPLTDQLPASTNTVKVPIARDTPWGSGGIQLEWEGEATETTVSKHKLELETQRLRKIKGLIGVTEELFDDSVLAEAYLRTEIAKTLRYMLNIVIVSGTGTTQPLGILNSDATITVAKEAAQQADTFVEANALNMLKRLAPASFANAVWLVHLSALPNLISSCKDYYDESTKDDPFGRLFTRPILVTEACELLGDRGDVVLADLTSYRTILKRPTPETAISMHLWFDYGISAFRVVLRIDGQPKLRTPIPSDKVGGESTSPFVTLAARA